MITQKRLKEFLHYDPETGVFTWLVHRHRVSAGRTAGGTDSHGHRQIKIEGVMYLAHRLAWLYVHGVWPEDQIDHRNGIRADNRIENIREATNGQNQQNQKRAHIGSKSGFLGVSRKNGRWEARIQLNKKQICVGTFKTPELAHAAYLTAKREMHPFTTL